VQKKQGYASIDEYIQSFPAHIQERLAALRLLVKEAAPDAQEKISYQMPAFHLNGNLVYFAGYAKHIGFYPGSSKNVFSRFKEELSDFKSGRGSVQFPLDQPLPVDLIRRIVKFRADENIRKGKK
jgi:uncharacterized protein YdhG (YjbR/CyaY superfamily)